VRIVKEAIKCYEIMKRQIELVQIRYRAGSRSKSTVLLVLATTLLITLHCISCSTIFEESQSDAFADDEVRRLFSSDVNGEHLALFYYR
jgi:hypothetical protein